MPKYVTRHPMYVHGVYVAASASEPKVVELTEAQAKDVAHLSPYTGKQEELAPQPLKHHAGTQPVHPQGQPAQVPQAQQADKGGKAKRASDTDAI